MKTRTLLIVLLSFSMLFTMAQEDKDKKDEEAKTVITKSDEKMAHGGYGAFGFGYNQIDGEAGMIIGGRGAYLMNHRLGIGFAGYGFFNGLSKENEYAPSDYSIAGGYGGLFIEPVIMNKKPVHLTIPIIFGVGGAATVQNLWADNYNNSYYYNDYRESGGDVFLVFEPGIDVEFNITKIFRMGLGASYRLTNGVNLIYYYEYYEGTDLVQDNVKVNTNALDGFTFHLVFKFGWF